VGFWLDPVRDLAGEKREREREPERYFGQVKGRAFSSLYKMPCKFVNLPL
jgi:hypothetical protein